MTGIVFDIKEFGLHDGAGLRTTVFLKGCPMRCAWCHNPEGISQEREVVRNLKKCTGCGLCRKPCDHEECRGLGYCTKICPEDNVKAAGEEYTPEKLAERLLQDREFLEFGGVTFSGGEPLRQTDFILETISHLEGIRTAVETCGYVAREDFRRAAAVIDDIYIDIKLFDEEEHKKWTGCSNRLILENVAYLMDAGKDFTVRTPLIPGVTDKDENFEAIASFLAPAKARVKVELIPYNVMTGAKYRSVGKEYRPPFDEAQPLNKNTRPYEEKGIRIMAY